MKYVPAQVAAAMEDSQECQFCGYCEYKEEPKINFWNEHLHYVGETYWQHALVAGKLSLRLLASSVAQAIHLYCHLFAHHSEQMFVHYQSILKL